MRFTRGIGWAGAVLALAVAVALFTRFSFDDTMRRDEAIYAYGGQQLAAGGPPYRGVFDPKTPVGQAPAGGGARAGGRGGRSGAGAGVRRRPRDPRGVLRRGVPERRRGLLAGARAVGLAAGGAAGRDRVRVVPVVRARRRGRAGREDAGDPVRGARAGAADAPEMVLRRAGGLPRGAGVAPGRGLSAGGGGSGVPGWTVAGPARRAGGSGAAVRGLRGVAVGRGRAAACGGGDGDVPAARG